MKRTFVSAALVATVVLAGCNWLGVSGAPDRSEPIRVERGTPFWLAIGQTASAPSDVRGDDGQPLSQTLTFSDVLSDSRCPTDAACVWGGQAQIIVGRSHPTMRFGGPDTLLVGEKRDGDSDTAGPWRALDLRPYPRTDQPTTPKRAYRAQFVFE